MHLPQSIATQSRGVPFDPPNCHEIVIAIACHVTEREATEVPKV